MENQSAVKIGRRGGKVSCAEKATAARENSLCAALVKSGEARCKCNKNHSGNRSLCYDVGYFACQGCGEFHAPESVRAALDGPIAGFDGGGGCIRVK
jgi:hypothetical protein